MKKEEEDLLVAQVEKTYQAFAYSASKVTESKALSIKQISKVLGLKLEQTQYLMAIANNNGVLLPVVTEAHLPPKYQVVLDDGDMLSCLESRLEFHKEASKNIRAEIKLRTK